ncbi:MAG: DUF819 family protein [Pseudomonadota bacterium]
MPGETLISSSNTVAVFTALMAVVAIGLAMERHAKLGQFGTMFVILFPALLTATSILPRSSPVYGFVNGQLVALSIPMLLFNADLRVIWKQSGRVMIAFLLATLATVIAGVCAAFLVDLGSEEPVWVGMMTAAFIGGAVNIAAVAGAFEMTGDPRIGLMFASIYVVLIPYFLFLMYLPSLGPLWRLFSGRTQILPDGGQDAPAAVRAVSEARALEPFGFAAMVALAGSCVLIGEGLAHVSGMPALKFLGLSLVAILIATLSPATVRRLRGHTETGHVLIYAFLAVMGSAIDFSVVTAEGVPIIVFVTILLALHLVLVSVFGRVLKLNGPELLVAANSCILGPPTAAAMATARGWPSLVTPGILVGVFGWAIASFIGVGLAMVL